MIDPMTLHGIIYILIGAFAGLMAGLFGIGGGIVVIPGLLFVFQETQAVPAAIVMHAAIATSLATMIVTSLASVYAHHRIETILWTIFNKLWPSLIAGTITGALVAEWIPTPWLVTLFAIFLFSVAIKMSIDAKVTHTERFPKSWVNYLITFLVGTNSGLLGVGGGILMVPYLTYCGIAPRKIVAVTNLCALTIALAGTLFFILTSYKMTSAIPFTIGYVYWPAIILVGIPSSIMARVGARLHYKLPLHQLRYGFIAMLFLTATALLL